MRNLFGKTGLGVVAAAVMLGVCGGAVGQQPTKPAPQLTGPEREELVKRQDMLRDFIHYVLINRPDVAAGMGQQLLNKNMAPTNFVDLVEGSGEAERFGNTIGRAMRSPELEGTAASLLKLYEQGKLERVRDPKEIEHNIDLLKTGNQRAVRLAQERLAAAGEYAMPQLLGALQQGQDTMLRARAQQLMVGMGQQAVTPLCTALVKTDPVSQEMIAAILGLIGYRTSLPYLTDTLMNTSNSAVRSSCEQAISRIGNASGDAAELYEQLGEGYYAEKPELTSFPGEPYQLLWTYDPTIGLTMTGIKTEVFHEAMAMRTAERSLELRPQGNDRAMSLWLASNFSREIQSPAEYDNPAYPKSRRTAMYYAVAAGAGPSQAVLGRAIDTRNTPLARKSIAAIEQTAGGGALWTGQGDRRPLLEALRYPNRRVQYEAAMSLGKAQPRQAFAGSERVVPLLASAIRDAGVRYAAVVASDKERGAGIRKALEKSGYTVLPVASSMSEIAQPIAEAPGIDLVVTNLSSASDTNEVIENAKQSAKLGVTPILALTESAAVPDQTRRYDRDLLVSVRGSGVSDAQLVEAASQLVERSVGGPIKPEEARDYATKSVSVLRDLAVSGNTVFDVGDASSSLISALGETNGKMRLDIAEVLSRVEQKRAQVALMDAAMTATGEERNALLGKVADSAKRFGNLLEPRQVERAIELASTAPGDEATAAAALVGSLNLPNTNLVPFILQRK